MRFIEKYEFLSNFFPCTVSVIIEDEVVIFRNAEAAFQAQKNSKLAKKFMLLTGYEAKKLGKQLPLDMPLEEWNTKQRYFAMAKALYSKFSDPQLFTKLKNITEEIVEDNYWNDTFWGRCKGKGKNILGRMLMCIRDSNNDFDTLFKFCIDVSNDL